MRFSIIDIPLFLALGVGGYLGFRGGPARKLFNLLMLLLSFVVAGSLMDPIGSYVAEADIMSKETADIAAFTVVLTAIMVSAILLYRRFGKKGMGRPFANVLGTIFGVVEGALITSFVLFAFQVLDVPDQDTQKESLLYRPLVNFMPKTFELLQSYFPGASGLRDELMRHFQNYTLPEGAGGPGKQS
jgi:uncharacterized membrane protein required for colicin V production